MTVFNTTESQLSQPQTSGLVRGIRFLYIALGVILLASVGLQVFFAGAALLVNSSYLELHRTFAHILELFAILLPIVAIFSRLGWRLGLMSLLPFFLIALQYIFLYAVVGMGLPLWTRGLHAANAIVIFWVALHLTTAALRQSRAV
jgi:hypothetical protein